MPADPGHPTGESLAAQTLRAAKWTYASTFLMAAVQVGVTAALARLVTPEAYGILAMAMLVLRFGQYFAQMGVGQALVQRPTLHEDHVRAGFWVSVILGTTFSLVAWVFAPIAATVFDTEELTRVLPAMGLVFVINGTSAAALATLRRGMRFKSIAIAEVTSYTVGYAAVGVTLAVLGLGVWALVSAALSQAALSTLAVNLVARPPIAPIVRLRPYRELLGFGSTVSVVTFMEFVNSNLDTIVIGRLSGAGPLGTYNRALMLTGLPMQYMSTSLSRVLLPSFSRIQTDAERLRAAYLSVMTIFAGLGIPIALGMSAAAREIVLVVLGPDWTAAIQVVRIVAVAAVAGMLSHFGGVTLEATARLRDKLAMRLGQLVLFGAALIGLGRFGLVGYALAFAISEVTFHAVQAVRLGMLFGISAREQVSAYWPGISGGAAALAGLTVESWVGTVLDIPVGAVLVMQILTGAAVLSLVVLKAGNGRLFGIVHTRIKGSLRRPLAVRTLGWATRLSPYDPTLEADGR